MTMGDYVSRLAVVLPLMLMLLGGLYHAAKRGWIRAPGLATGTGAAAIRVVTSVGVAPGSRLVVVEFDGRRLLLAATRSGTVLLDRAAGGQ